ncbi:major facilitator superfamily transporter [Biscogniauxia mediterranea]|nr:major facilitator superfamily transporter [Biscogniauxia mediterranea]
MDSDSDHTDDSRLQPHRVATNASAPSTRSRFRIAHDTGFGHLSELVQTISTQDAADRYRTEEADNRVPSEDAGDSRSLADTGERVIISWDENDKENPHNWSKARKWYIVITAMLVVINSTMGSALSSMAVPYMTAEWGVTSETQKILPQSTYLMGYVCGPLFWGPLSEQIGRQKLTIGAFVVFMVWTMACALAPNWLAFLVFRFLTGAFASAPMATVTGIIADVYDNPVSRGRAMAWFMVMTLGGPLFAPIISGFCSTSIGWRWSFWVGLIYAGLCLVDLAFLPETYAPVLLTRRAVKLRKENPKAQVYSSMELEDQDFRQLVTRVLTRPIRMIMTELIVMATCLYLALVYSIFYMSFQAFPLIFQGIYHLSPGVTGLLFLPIGAGALGSLAVFFAYDRFLRDAQARAAPWTQKEEYRRVPLAFLGGPLFVVSLFWLGWSARADVPFAVVSLAGVPFGAGFVLIFMALLNYLTDAYEIFAASANAAASSARSLFAVVLPFATTPMFARLGVDGACSLLGGLSLLMCAIPYVFIWKGERIRAGSKFSMALRQHKLEMQQRAEEKQRRKEKACGDGALLENKEENV